MIRNSQELRQQLDPKMVKAASLSTLAFGAFVVASEWHKHFAATLAAIIAWQAVSIVTGRALSGTKHRSLGNGVFCVINTAATLAVGVLTNWTLVAAMMLPFTIATFELFSDDGDTRRWVLVQITIVGAAMLGVGLPWQEVGARVMLTWFIHWLAASRSRAVREALGELSTELKARLHAEAELRQAQKLESVGRLAAGVAHEINTPVQFVTDSLEFLGDGTRALKELLEKYRAAAPANEALKQADEEADLEFLQENLLPAIDTSRDGLKRIAVIVRSMRDFAHPEEKEMKPVDVNRAIESTLVIASSEYKHVADLDLKLQPGLKVHGHAGELNQVVLNLVVNAAHAISDRNGKGSAARGRISVQGRNEGEDIVVSIADTGCGIPDAIRDRIFDPFFTTKEVGRGTGQGLAIARSVVAKHGGALTFESRLGEGTTFVIRLPALA